VRPHKDKEEFLDSRIICKREDLSVERYRAINGMKEVASEGDGPFLGKKGKVRRHGSFVDELAHRREKGGDPLKETRQEKIPVSPGLET